MTCPECGRAFDSGDPRTFLDDPRARRRRLIKRWVVSMLIAATFLFVFCPRGVRRATLAYSFPDGSTMAVSRWELKPARWLPIRYPGFNRTVGTPTSTKFSVSITSFGMMMTSSNAPPESPPQPIVNGIPVTVDNGGDVLRTVTSPNCTGITLTVTPPEFRTVTRPRLILQDRIRLEDSDDSNH